MIKKIILWIVCLYVLYLWYMIAGFGHGCNRKEAEKHIMPDGYVGRVLIVFDDEQGVERTFKNDFRLYQIPASGLLRTQFEQSPGTISADNELKFYYQRNDSLLEIPKLISTADFDRPVDSNQIYVMEYGLGGIRVDFIYEGGGITSYIVDSIKNMRKVYPRFTQQQFDEQGN